MFEYSDIFSYFISPFYHCHLFSQEVYYNFIDAKDPADFDRFIALVKELSFYDTGVSASYGDELLTLITCWDYQGNGRMNIVAKKIEPSIAP